jgi:hypothetical protein
MEPHLLAFSRIFLLRLGKTPSGHDRGLCNLCLRENLLAESRFWAARESGRIG